MSFGESTCKGVLGRVGAGVVVRKLLLGGRDPWLINISVARIRITMRMYIYIERERDRYIYIYIERERDR